MNILLLFLTIFLSCISLAMSAIFTLNKFSFPSLSPIMFPKPLSPRISRLRKVDVTPLKTSPITTNMKLIEFLFTRMKFNYNNIVPSQKWLTFKLP